jgi:WD40 repeat protein
VVVDLTSAKVVPLDEGAQSDHDFRLAWSPDSKLIACANVSQTVWVCDAETGARRQTLTGHSGGHGLAWSPDGKLLAAADNDNKVAVWKAGGDWRITQFWRPGNWVHGIVFSPDGRRLACWLEAKCLVWDTADGHEVGNFAVRAERFAFSADGRRLSALDRENHVRRFDLDTGKLAGETRGPPRAGQWFTSQWSADTRRAVNVEGNAAYLWNADDGTRPGAILALRDAAVQVAPDGHYRVSRGRTCERSFRAEQDLVYVALTDSGEQLTLSPAEFSAKYGWQNNPAKAELKLAPTASRDP